MPFSRPYTPPALSSGSLLSGSNGGHGTPPDHDMMEPSPRPSLPSSLADFALPHSAPSSPSMSLMALDEPHPYAHSPSPIGHPLLRKIRRPSLLGIGLPKAPFDMNFLSTGYSSRMNSPLVTSFTSPFSFDCPPNGSPNNGRSGGNGTPGGNGNQPNGRPDDDEELAPELMFENVDPSPPLRETSPEATQLERDGSPVPSALKRRSRSSTPTRPSLQPPIDIDYKQRSVPRRTLSSSTSAPNLSLRAHLSGTNNGGNSSNTNNVTGNNTSSTSRIAIPPRSPMTATGLGFGGLLNRPAIPRLLTIMNESNTQESEVRSEASFQRLIASHAELPPRRGHPRTPRSRQNSASGMGIGRRAVYYPNNRGRFPEEAFDEDDLLADDDQGSSDDGDDEESAAGGTAPPSAGNTQAGMSFNDDSATSLMSVAGSIGSAYGSQNMGGALDSPAGMDLDVGGNGWSQSMMFGSPPVNNGMIISNHSTPSHSQVAQWRHTPPPTATASRGSKRKLVDDRYEPYPSAKRRAVSPAVSISGSSMMMAASPIPIPRSPITIARPLPLSATSSPILRPVVRLSSARGGGSNPMLAEGGLLMLGSSGSWNASMNGGKGEEREVQGANDGVGSLTL